MTGTPSPLISSNNGRRAGSSTENLPMIGWKWNPVTPSSRTADFASAIASSPLPGSTAPHTPTNVSGCRARSAVTYALSHGGAPVTDSMSNATSIALMPWVFRPATTSSSPRGAHGLLQ
jgi:hypothetical protein